MATSLTISILTDVSKAISGIDSVDEKTQSFGKKMAGVAGAIGGVFSVTKIKGWAEEWVNAGLDASRAVKNVKAVFDESAPSVTKWADTTAAAFGMTAADAEKAAAKVGVALEGYGLSNADAAKQSEALVARSADVAKVLGVDQAEVLGKVETAMRGRTAGLKDYGVEVAKGSSETEIFNAFMQDTEKYAGSADTGLGNLHGTFGDITAQLGQALIPILNDLIPLIQAVADWAKNNKTAFNAIVLVFTAMALIMGIAATVAGILAIAEWSVLWPVLLVVAAVAALIVVTVLIIAHWSTLVGWFHEGVSAVVGFIDKFQVLILLFGGPLGAAIVGVRHFKEIWQDVKSAIDGVVGAIQTLFGWAEKVGEKLGGILSKIPGVKGAPGDAGAGGPAGVSAYGVSAYAAPAPVFSPVININGDIGDPVLAGRRIVAALETWTAANGRRRITALVGGS